MNQRVLITGGAGFIGSQLAGELHRSGYEVRVLDAFANRFGGGRNSVPRNLKSGVQMVRGDVRREEDLKLSLNGVDMVFHLAASVGANQSMTEVRSYMDHNTMATATLLQLLIKNPVKRLVVASSMSLYGEGLYHDREGRPRDSVRRTNSDLGAGRWEPVDAGGRLLKPVPTPETKPADLSSVYALSKYDQERLCLMIGASYGIPTTALRIFNVYGAGQSTCGPRSGVIANFASCMLRGLPPQIHEDGLQKRDFVHVSDVARACRLAAEKPDSVGRVLNIGSGESHTILEVANEMQLAMGLRSRRPDLTGKHRAGDVRHCFADIRLAREVLGFQPKVSLRDGMADLVRWLRTEQDEVSGRGIAI